MAIVLGWEALCRDGRMAAFPLGDHTRRHAGLAQVLSSLQSSQGAGIDGLPGSRLIRVRRDVNPIIGRQQFFMRIVPGAKKKKKKKTKPASIS